MTDFDDLLAKAEAASAGPWTSVVSGQLGDESFLVTLDKPGHLHPVCVTEHGAEKAEDDAAYIAAASPDVIRALVLRLREAEKALRRARDQMDAMVAGPDGFTTIYPDPKLEVEVIDAYFSNPTAGSVAPTE